MACGPKHLALDKLAEAYISRRCISNEESTHALDFSEVQHAAQLACDALKAGSASTQRPAREGVSGTYLIVTENTIANNSNRDVIAVFKPVDEEVGGFDNPNGGEDLNSLERILRRSASGFQDQPCAYKEAAAYILDHEGYCGVPQTKVGCCTVNDRPKPGAIQVYVQNEGDADDFGPGVFDTETVQRIAAFDIRTINHDRHGGNLLAVTKPDCSVKREGALNLIPIDHGYILPESIQTAAWPVWMDWPQVREPVTASVRKYVASIDIAKDLGMLQDNLGASLRSGSRKTLVIGTMLLQLGVQMDKTLFDIGAMIFSRDNTSPSALEEVIIEHDRIQGLKKTVCSGDFGHEINVLSFDSVALSLGSPSSPSTVVIRETSDLVDNELLRSLLSNRLLNQH